MAFRVQGELAMDGSKFFGVMSQAGAAVNRFGNAVTSGIGGKLAAAFSVGAMGLAIRRTMDYADSIEELSQRIGVGTDKLQEWTFAAKQSGADTEKLVTFIERLNTAATDIKNLGGFQAMGINPAGMTSEQLFGAVSGFTRGKSGAEIIKALEGVGLGVKQIGPMVNVLSSDLDAAGQSARRLGAVMDAQTVHQFAILNDQLSIVGQVLMGNFAPALLAAGIGILQMAGAVQATIAFIKASLPKDFSFTNAVLQPGVLFGQLFEDLIKGMAGDKEVAGRVKSGVKSFKSVDDAIAAMVAAIQNYQPPAPGVIPAFTPETSRKPSASARIQADALVSVGNFLGTTRSKIELLSQQQVELLRRIAENTRPQPSNTSSGFPV